MNTVLFVNATIGLSENLFLVFREKILDLRPKSVCAVEMTMYVLHWTCVNMNRKDVHA